MARTSYRLVLDPSEHNTKKSSEEISHTPSKATSVSVSFYLLDFLKESQETYEFFGIFFLLAISNWLSRALH